MVAEKLQEQISALVDDELPAGEHELLVRRFSLEKYLRIRWERYHLIGEAMRNALPQIDTRGFADRIMKALEDEIALTQKQEARLIRYFTKVSAGMAVAACVAFFAIFGLRYGHSINLQSASAHSEVVPESTATSIQSSPVNYGMARNAAWNGDAPEIQAELSNYVINHNEITTSIEQQGMLPYFYVSSFQHGARIQPSKASQNSGQQDKR